MNTPSHLILNLATLRRPAHPEVTWPVLIGAFVPDAAMFVFYAWVKFVERLPDSTIWNETFFSQSWQDIFAIGNSIPLVLLGIGATYAWRKWAWLYFFASMLLHQLCDLPVHHDDAHRHFVPLSNYRFISPVSYWDPDHYGALIALIESSLVLIASVYLWRQVRSRLGRGLLLLTNVVYVAGYVAFYARA
ncbi:MAG TPA: hypothetical protein V6D07_04680 [Trichocoleus sp.]